jgi:hypothetical protein
MGGSCSCSCHFLAQSQQVNRTSRKGGFLFMSGKQNLQTNPFLSERSLPFSL